MVLKEMWKDIVWFFTIVGTLVSGAANGVAVPGHYIVKKQEREQVQSLRNKTQELSQQVCGHPEIKRQKCRQKYSGSHLTREMRRPNG